jgi:hypothetical protein
MKCWADYFDGQRVDLGHELGALSNLQGCFWSATPIRNLVHFPQAWTIDWMARRGSSLPPPFLALHALTRAVRPTWFWPRRRWIMANLRSVKKAN